MIHFCQDEALALASAVPFIGLAWRWLRSKLSRKSPGCRGIDRRR